MNAKEANHAAEALPIASRAVWLGEPFPKGPPLTPLDDVPRAVEGVKALFEESFGTRRRTATARVDPETETAPL